jgi:hypothetical protein
VLAPPVALDHFLLGELQLSLQRMNPAVVTLDDFLSSFLQQCLWKHRKT